MDTSKRKRYGSKPEFMVVYLCSKCELDSGMTELDEPKCYYCMHTEEGAGELKLISKEKITPEAIAYRMKVAADRIMENLSSAYDSMDDELKDMELDGEDFEKKMLELLERTKRFNDNIHEMDLTDSKEEL